MIWGLSLKLSVCDLNSWLDWVFEHHTGATLFWRSMMNCVTSIWLPGSVMQALAHAWTTAYGSQFSPSAIWVSEIKLRPLGLTAIAFTQEAIYFH